MHPANIVRVGAVYAAFVVGACGFSPSGQGGGTTGAGANSGAGSSASGIGNFGGSSTGQGGLTGAGGVMECAAIEMPSTKLPPDILILFDASGSMNQDAMNVSCGNQGCGATSKWALMVPALNTVVSQTETEVNWGLKFFADSGSCGVNNNAAVGIATMNAGAIATAIMGRTSANGGVSNGSSTPTRAGMNGATTYLMGQSSRPNPKFIVLATDGQPNCPASGNSNDDDTPGAVAAVTAARMAGFSTFVVGISAGGAPEMALNMMAVEGGYPRMATPQYYPVTSTDEFATTLRTLVGMATTCTFSVPNPPNDMTSRGNIKVRGRDASGNVVEIPMDATNGWTYANAAMTSIILNGTACDNVTAGTYTGVTIVFNCVVG
jgi:hypothetical protein